MESSLASPDEKIIIPEVEYSFSTKSKWKPRTVKDYRDLYLSGTKLPIEIAENVIKNIQKFNPKLNMICDHDEELIR